MIPEALEKKVFEIEKGSEEINYEIVKEVAVTMALRRSEQRKPMEDEAMSMGMKRRQEEEGEEWAWGIDRQEADGWWGGWGAGEFDVDALGMRKGSPSIKCIRCGALSTWQKNVGPRGT